MLGETFQRWQQDIVDLPYSGPPRTATMECSEQKVDVIVTED
jgi:hypothetical protein